MFRTVSVARYLKAGQFGTIAMMARALNPSGALQDSTATRSAMQSTLTAPTISMTTGIAIHAADVAPCVEPAPKARPAAAAPKRPLRERLRRPLLIAFPLLLAVAGGAY